PQIMKIKPTLKSALLCYAFILSGILCFAQVGIGTISPHSSSLLDIGDEAGTKGILIPRISLTATNISSPISPAPVESLLIYNTVTSGSDPYRVYPGYYYWNGTRWIPMVGPEKWNLLGNSGTSQNINFVGTTDAQALSFRTNNLERFRIANENQVLAMANGTSSLPFYSWNGDVDTGIYRIGDNNLGFSTNQLERLRLNLNESVFNDPGFAYNFRVESDNQANMLYVNGTTDRIGINTNSPQTELHIAGSNATLRIEELNTTNSIHN